MQIFQTNDGCAASKQVSVTFSLAAISLRTDYALYSIALPFKNNIDMVNVC